MELSFSSKELRDICEKTAAANKLFSKGSIPSLHSIISEFRSAKSIQDMPTGTFRLSGPSEEKAKYSSRFFNISISAAHNKPPKNGSDTVNWELVHRIKITNIEENKHV